VAVFVAAVAPGNAQTAAPPPLPSPGFVPAFEIMRTVRAAGFDPLAPPLREGTIYVLRATDYRGILMRVVVDARTGAIRDANRIVSAYGPYGTGYGPSYSSSYGPGYGPAADTQLGMMAPYAPAPRGVLPPYGPPPDFDAPETGPDTEPGVTSGVGSGGAPPPAAMRAPASRTTTRAAITLPPLPRPRPAALAAKSAPTAAAIPAAPVAPAAPFAPSKATVGIPPIND
jgi:hypothetical protein